MLPLETLIDDKKLTNAKNEFYELLSKKHYQDGLNNFLKHHNARVKFFQKFRFLKWIALLVSILTALFSILFLIIWIIEKQQALAFLVFFVLSLVVSLAYGFAFIKYDKVNQTKDSTHQLNKFLTALYKFNANAHFKITFKNMQKQSLPFLAIYDCSDDNIVYYRKMDNDKTKVWQEPIQKIKTSYYLMGDNFCLIFKKPTSQNHQMFFFIDESNKETLETYLKQMGLTKLLLPNK